MLRQITILFCLVLFTQVVAQKKFSSEFNFIHYTIDQGLSQASVNDIIIDKSGYLWIATQDGLNRFDGSSFLVFRHNNQNDGGICGNFINSLLLDSNKLWIGTRSSGVCFYNIENNSFRNFNKLSGNDIICLQKDRLHNIYASLNNNNIAVIHPAIDGNYTTKTISVSNENSIATTGLYISDRGTIWAGTKEGRLFYAKSCKNPDSISFSEYDLKGINPGNINVIKSNNRKEIWIGTRKGLYRLNIRTHTLSRFKLSSSKKSEPLIIYDIRWKNDEMWIATGNGLTIINLQSGITKSIKHKELNTNSLSNNTVTSILFDDDGQGWIGTGKFLNLLYKNPIVNIIKSEAGNRNSLNSNVIFSIRKNKGAFLIGTSGGGFNLMKNNRFYAFTKEKHQLPSNIVFSTMIDKHGSIWLGTKEGLSIIDNNNTSPEEMKVTNIFHSSTDETTLSNNFIRQIYRDNNNNVWLCTYNGGLNRFTGDVAKKIFTFCSYKRLSSDPYSIFANRVYCIRQTKENEYWVGTIKGLALLSFGNTGFEEPHFTRLTVDGEPVLTNNVIYDITVSQNGDKWIGTRNGLFRYSPSDKTLKHFTQKDGMPNNIVYGILEDKTGNIWASTNNGISCYNRKTKKFINYNPEDGFADKEFNLQARFRDDDGILYFGGINGISFFNPDRMGELDQQNKLYFNSLLVTNYKTNQLEKLTVQEDKTVTLRSNQFPFYVNFSNINLTYHKNTKFAYRLKPDYKQWNFIGKNRKIQFLNLTAGKYTLEIQGVSRGRVWENTKPLKLEIEIIPPWWKSGYAFLMYLLLFLTITYIVYRFNINRNLEHHERLRLLEIDKLKTNFYTNITHELRTPLTVILGITEEINDNLDEKEREKYSRKLNVLTRNSRKLLLLINQVLDLSKVEKNKLVLKPVCSDVILFLKVITESFHSLAKHKNIEFVYYNETESFCMDFDRDKLSIVISNLLSNAIKFTNKYGKVILHVKSEKHKSGAEVLIVKVKDSGIGISAEDKMNIFNRFFQAKRADDGAEEGTGIGLAIVKEYIGLMGGTVDVESSPGKGTIFTLKIPVSKKAPKDESSPAAIGEKINPLSDEEKPTIDINAPLLLIVEDNRDVADYIASCIEPGYQIMFAHNGNEGIEKAVKYVPDIIITDLMMPGKDGFELCNTLKDDTTTSHIPIIMLTARSLEQDKLNGYSAGADAYLIKPFSKKELLVRIQQLTELRKKLQQKYSDSAMQTGKPVTREDEFLNTLSSIIDNNIDNTEYKSATLARDIGLSESQLYRKIKALTKFSTAIFIRNYRLEKAKEMLKDRTLNISEIAYRCGFNDPAWFAHAFKDKYKVSPTEYRSWGAEYLRK